MTVALAEGMRWTPFVLATILIAAGCSAGSLEPSLDEGTPEPADEAGEALSGSIPIGTTLRATTALNLRSGPSTGNQILRVIPSGAKVKTVNTSSSKNGFYNVEYNGTVGWSYGGYLDQTGGGGSGDAYYLTSFGGGNDTQGMACGGTADGTWWYAADSQRFGCGSKLLVRAGSKCVVVKVADYGPAKWVESNAGRPIIDASPLACKYFFGTSSCGWSDHRAIVVRKVEASHPTGLVTCF